MNILLELSSPPPHLVVSEMCDELKTELKWEMHGPTVPLKQQSTRQQRGEEARAEHVVASLECY